MRLASAQRGLEHTRTYEWVELAVPLPELMPAPALRSTLDWVIKARNACLVWHMLACCRGFQAHENDAFWKRLIEYVGKKPRREDVEDSDDSDDSDDEEEDERQWWGATPPVSDAHKFFPVWWDEEQTTFPRFQLHVPYSQYFQASGYVITDDDLDNVKTAADWIKNVVKTFIGLRCAHENTAIKDYVSELLESIKFDRFCAMPVEIGVHLGSAYELKNLADTFMDLIAGIDKDALARKEKYPWRLIGQSRFPLAKFTELSLCDQDAITDEGTLNALTDIIRKCNLAIPQVIISPSADRMGFRALTNFMNVVSRSNPKGARRVDTLQLNLQDAAEWQIELLFSAIPITRVQTLRVVGNTDVAEGGETLSHHAWTWLAYAAYHPWLTMSILNLDLEMLDVSEPSAVVMEGALTAQRHLYRLIHDEEDETLPAEDNFDAPLGQYTIVTVRDGACCYKGTSLTGGRRLVRSGEITLTAMVKSDTSDIQSLPRAVCVIAQGMGVRWVARADITKIGGRFADFSEVWGLRLGQPRANPEMELSALHGLVHNLQILDISAWRKLTSEELLEVLHECFMVQDLSVHHGGELFHDWTETTPDMYDDLLWDLQMTSLHLVLPADHPTLRTPSPAAWEGILYKLEELTIQTVGARERLLPYIRQLFQEASPIKRFIWRDIGDHRDTSYAEKRASCRNHLGISEGRFDKVQHALCPAGRRAFASVIKRKAIESNKGSHERSAMGRVGSDVARLICDFATSDSKRAVWFEDR